MAAQAPKHQLAVQVTVHHAEPARAGSGNHVACNVEATDGSFEKILGESRERDSQSAGKFGKPAASGGIGKPSRANAFVEQLPCQGFDEGTFACTIWAEDYQSLGWIVA